MTSQHLTPEACEAFVRGELAGQALVALEAHVAACAPCAQALTREARLEESLHAVARADQGPLASVTALRRRRVVVGAVVSALAAGLALVASLPHLPAAEQAPRVVRCDGPAATADCVERARFDGVLAVGPGRRVEVPRYDEVPAPAGGGTP